MLINIFCAKCVGIDAVEVNVEVDIATGIGIHLVGLADAAVKESLLRTITALQSLGFRIPGKKIVINLAPADMHKKGSGYDLPIALGIIAASGQRELPLLGEYMIMGELGLDGTVRQIPGALPIVELACRKGLKGAILPLDSAAEAAEFKGTTVYGIDNMDDVMRILSGEELCDDLLVGFQKEQNSCVAILIKHQHQYVVCLGRSRNIQRFFGGKPFCLAHGVFVVEGNEKHVLECRGKQRLAAFLCENGRYGQCLARKGIFVFHV